MDVIQLWWLYLLVALVVTVVVAVLLGMIVAAAQRIDRHAEAIWVVGKQIAGNTVSIWLLEKTNAELRRLADHAEKVERCAAAIGERVREHSAETRR